MNADTRRIKILEHLSKTTAPVSATVLAGMFSVSRQVIVGDIALLRAAGEDITATPRGYVISKETPGLIKTVAVQHRPEETEKELCIFVDNGCIVLKLLKLTGFVCNSHTGRNTCRNLVAIGLLFQKREHGIGSTF